MVAIAAGILAAIKSASNAFQNLSEKERLAALAQAQFLEDAAKDLLEPTDEYNRTQNLEPHLVSKFSASIKTAGNFAEIKAVKDQAEAALKKVAGVYEAQYSGPSQVLTGDDIRRLRELAESLLACPE